MEHGTVLLVGHIPDGGSVVGRLAAEFGWFYCEARNLDDLMDLSQDLSVVAVLFSPEQLKMSWQCAVRSILHSACGALPILCHGFREAADTVEMADAGVFHTLRMPFDDREVRQSLGFVWSVKQRPSPVRLRQIRAVA